MIRHQKPHIPRTKTYLSIFILIFLLELCFPIIIRSCKRNLCQSPECLFCLWTWEVLIEYLFFIWGEQIESSEQNFRISTNQLLISRHHIAISRNLINDHIAWPAVALFSYMKRIPTCVCRIKGCAGVQRFHQIYPRGVSPLVYSGFVCRKADKTTNNKLEYCTIN